jgi:hypothetical protein
MDAGSLGVEREPYAPRDPYPIVHGRALYYSFSCSAKAVLFDRIEPADSL